ncbi:MAG: glycosyltransferase [Acidobacteria bacterium]|nr:glycosyltransferase [Acidobacteriota bacterium]
MTGVFPEELSRGIGIDHIDYQLLDGFTWEVMADDDPVDLYSFVLSPPYMLHGGLQKGVLMTMGPDYLVRQIPEIKQYFYLLATSRWCSIPWSQDAEVLGCLYENPARERWFRDKYSARDWQLFAPIQEADWTNDTFFCPDSVEKTYDVVCLSRLASFKNLDIFAAALQHYWRQYGQIRVLFLPGFDGPNAMDQDEYALWRLVVESLPSGYVDTRWYTDAEGVRRALNQSKSYVLTSLVEGKNRGLHEAMCCDLPVVVFRDFNKAARGGASAFPDGAGLVAQFDPSDLASTLKSVGSRTFSPRRSYLNGFSGRRWSVARVFQALGQASLVAGDFRTSPLAHCIRDHYQLELEDIIYDRTDLPTYWVGLAHHREGLSIYKDRCFV